jgi:hypothetical protein
MNEAWNDMKADAETKSRFRIRSSDGLWNFEIDRKPVIRARDRHWLRRLAVEVRRAVVEPVPR